MTIPNLLLPGESERKVVRNMIEVHNVPFSAKPCLDCGKCVKEHNLLHTNKDYKSFSDAEIDAASSLLILSEKPVFFDSDSPPPRPPPPPRLPLPPPPRRSISESSLKWGCTKRRSNWNQLPENMAPEEQQWPRRHNLRRVEEGTTQRPPSMTTTIEKPKKGEDMEDGSEVSAEGKRLKKNETPLQQSSQLGEAVKVVVVAPPVERSQQNLTGVQQQPSTAGDRTAVGSPEVSQRHLLTAETASLLDRRIHDNMRSLGIDLNLPPPPQWAEVPWRPDLQAVNDRANQTAEAALARRRRMAMRKSKALHRDLLSRLKGKQTLL